MMAKKNENYYYNSFCESAAISYEAALKLKSVLEPFDADNMQSSLDEIHLIEHKGDEKKHEVFSELVKAFITPIERDDIMNLSENLDNVIDCIEDILIHIYINNITEMRENIKEFLELLIKCCETLEKLFKEFHNFKKSKTLNDFIIEINNIEEAGDRLYISAMRELHVTEKDPIKVLAWRQIYSFFEKSLDACEVVADMVGDIVIANT